MIKGSVLTRLFYAINIHNFVSLQLVIFVESIIQVILRISYLYTLFNITMRASLTTTRSPVQYAQATDLELAPKVNNPPWLDVGFRVCTPLY